jgi:hypothetical protein
VAGGDVSGDPPASPCGSNILLGDIGSLNGSKVFNIRQNNKSVYKALNADLRFEDYKLM